MKIAIEKNKTLLEIKVAAVAVLALLLVMFTSQILRFMGEFAGTGSTNLGLIVRLVIIVVAAAAVIATWLQDKHLTYALDDGKLIVTAGLFMAQQQVMSLNPETVLNIELQQSFLGTKLDYGTIIIEVTHLSGTKVYTLANIKAPRAVFDKIDAYVHPPKAASPVAS